MRRFSFSLGLMLIGLPALAEVPKVVVDISPVHSLVTMVMGDLGSPTLLLPKGADVHDFQLRPSQALDLDAADLVIWVGPEMSPWLSRTLDGLGRDQGLALLDASQTLTRKYEDGEDGHDHAHDHSAEHDNGGHDDSGHDDEHDGIDPHAWLEPENARIWLGLIAEALATQDPEQADVYRANASAAQLEVTRVEAEVTARLAPVLDMPFAVLHDAYGYFTAHFGLRNVGSLRAGDAAAPGAGHVVQLQDGLRDSGAVCVFPEANHEAASARQMAEAVGARLGEALDPEGSLLTPSAALYGELMLGLADSLAKCLTQK